METILWGGLLRFGQGALAGAPTLLVGLVVAGVFRRLLGRDAVLRAFGGNSWRSLPQAWLWGMLLPVCSLGSIPVAYELRRAGLSGGAVLAFALTAPLFNPLSLLYGLTLSAPGAIVAFAVGSLLVVTVVGFVWDWLFPDAPRGDTKDDDEAPAVPGLKRLAAVGVAAAWHASGRTLLYVALCLAGTLVLSAVFSKGSLGSSMVHGDPTAPLLMLAIALPAYATPLDVMMQVGSMFVHGNSVGAAFVLLALGGGANLGLIAWAWANYGIRRTLVFLALFIGVVLAVAYAVEDPFYSAGAVEHPHTHAFDVYSNPFSEGQSNLPRTTAEKLAGDVQSYQLFGLAGVVLLVATGFALRPPTRRDAVERFLTTAPASNGPKRDVEIPAPVLGAVGVALLVLLSILGCFVYYPSPSETLADMAYAKADALSEAAGKNVELATKAIARYDDLSRRLEVGYYLRNGELSDFQRAKANALRGWLERLKDVVEEGDFERVREISNHVSNSHRRLREAFEGSAPIP
jgi:hypothetical protein